MQVLEDFQPFQYQLVENEDKRYVIRGVFSKADAKNKNGRIYPFTVLKEAVDRVQPMIQQNRFVGEVEHPSTPKINIERISHKITKLEMMNDGTVIGEMEVLNTESGRKVRELMQENVGLGVSTRALGGTKQRSDGTVEVLPGLQLKAIDIVFEPSAGEFGMPTFVAEGIEFDLNENQEEAKVKFSNILKRIF